jgi:DNA repair protein RecO (recombination protein O)
MLLTEKAFVLKRHAHGESDLIVHVLKSTGAKLSLFARAAKKSTKRFGGGVLEPMNYIRIHYQASRDGEGLSGLRDAELIKDFPGLRLDYDRLSVGLKFVETIHRFAQEGDVESQSLFNLLGNALSELEKTDSADLLRLFFDVKLLHYSGFLPLFAEAEEILRIPISEHASLTLKNDQIHFVENRVKQIFNEL